MKQLVIKIIVLSVIFLVSFSYLSGLNLNKNNYLLTELESANRPLIWVNDSNEYNKIQGYTQEMKFSSSHHPITLVNQNELLFLKDANNNSIRTIKYTVYDENDNRLDEGKALVEGEKIHIHLEYDLIEGRTYSLVIEVSTREDTFYYYTNIIKDVNHNIRNSTKVIMDFHNSTLYKDTSHVEAITEGAVLEGEEIDRLDLSFVDFNSTVNEITWHNISIKKMNEGLLELMDIIEDQLIFKLEYIALINGEDYYYITENYKVEVTEEDRIEEIIVIGQIIEKDYDLIDFSRSMRKVLTQDIVDTSNNKFHFGFTNVDEGLIIRGYNSDNNLWIKDQTQLLSYNRKTNEFSTVFNFDTFNSDFILDTVPKHQVEVWDTNEDGDIYYAVLGYMNAGPYEGKNGVLIKKYFSERYYNETVVFIPFEEAYENLIRDTLFIENVNEENEGFFVYKNQIYKVNIEEQTYEIVFEKDSLEKSNISISQDYRFITWEEEHVMDNNNIYIYDLIENELRVITSEQEERIEILGLIMNNIVIGYGKANLIFEENDDVIMPIHKVEIIDYKNEILKTYFPRDNTYVKDYSFGNNRVEFIIGELVNDEGEMYLQEVDKDFIVHTIRAVQQHPYNIVLSEKDAVLNEYVLEIPLNQDNSLFYIIAKEKRYIE
ncbi:hypothetical protein EDC19_2736 [Natranaerovirga hydrolytica]|uniref:Uncharacterized protein n=1 Tax=Natranaerovirga hydrolytica TaxID=680378 RepID=A0A4R1MDG9_9FIRM|nr:hypothetical protein [Natranaerovirga hydrolytica]TCK87893.1 hypothetical protein EDC19_2736 [Natranaerovirga hydrolytica]